MLGEMDSTAGPQGEDCSNYRGITVFSIAGKILARVSVNRLIPTIAQENHARKLVLAQSNRETTDMIFVLRQIHEKCREQNMGLYAAFVDLTKAYDTVRQDGLWKILVRLGCPPKFPTILCQLHDGQQGQVKQNGSLSGSVQRHQTRVRPGPHLALRLLQRHAA